MILRRPTRRRRVLATVLAGAAALAAVGALAACTGSATSHSVEVMGTWTGPERAAFLAVVAPFEHDTGIQVRFSGTRDLSAVLGSRVAAGDPPDLAVIPSPGELPTYLGQGLVPLDSFLDVAQLKDAYGSFAAPGQIDGRQYAVVVKADLKSLIWYSPRAFTQAGYQVPTTWADVTRLDGRISAAGGSPWCLGLESSSISGWPGTDWIEDIVLHEAGPQVYDQWAAGTLAWNSPPIRAAWQTFGEIVRHARGGAATALVTAFPDAGTSMFDAQPGCWLDHEGSFITSSYPSGLVAGRTLAFTPFPTIDPRYTGDQEVGGDLLGMFRDGPDARRLVQYLTSVQAQTIWVRYGGGTISPNRAVAASAYPDPLSRAEADLARRAHSVSFDASDLMPDAMQTAFYEAVLAYTDDPGRLDVLLADLDDVRAQAYGRG